MNALVRSLAVSSRSAPSLVQWLTWPLLFAANLGLALHAIDMHLDYAGMMTALLIANVAVLVTLEPLFPAGQAWRMTWRTLVRDLKYFAASGVTISATNVAFAALSIRLNDGHAGPISGLPLYASVPVALLVVDFFNYWQHRLSHELRGPVGRFLWNTHVAHHLPQQVYVLMHVAGHPLNIFFVRGFVNLLPLYLLGASAETVFLANVIVALQGLVSHCNLDLRAGWFNYLLVGTELHRYHHSADLSESKNYAATLSLLDIAFGTFRYRPGRLPGRLGVDDPARYPESNDFWRVMRLPFTRLGP